MAGPEGERAFREHARQLDPAEWPRVLRLVRGHRLEPQLWRRATPLDVLPAEVADGLRADAQARQQVDFWQQSWLDKLVPALQGVGIELACIKGLPLHRWLHGADAPPRGAYDVDLLVFGPRSEVRRAAAEVRAFGFVPSGRRFDPRTDAAWEARHAFTLERQDPGAPLVQVDLHRAPSHHHLRGAQAERLLAWFAAQRAPIAWRPAWPDGPASLPTLSPTGHLVYLAINLLKDAWVTLRSVVEIVRLLDVAAAELDWAAVDLVAREAGIAPALGAALDLARVWGDRPPRSLPRPWIPRALLGRVLGVRELIRGVVPATRTRAFARFVALHLAFGPGALVRGGRRYLRIRLSGRP